MPSKSVKQTDEEAAHRLKINLTADLLRSNLSILTVEIAALGHALEEKKKQYNLISANIYNFETEHNVRIR